MILAVQTVFLQFLHSQIPAKISTRWNDSFKEWVIYDSTDQYLGQIEMKWTLRNDWTDWTYRVGEESGTIKMKFKNDPDYWEIRGGNEIITARTQWRGQISEWNITTDHNRYVWRTAYRNQLDEWYVDNDDPNSFAIYSEFENDPRDWMVLDSEEISIHEKIALIFLAIHHASPKY